MSKQISFRLMLSLLFGVALIVALLPAAPAAALAPLGITLTPTVETPSATPTATSVIDLPNITVTPTLTETSTPEVPGPSATPEPPTRRTRTGTATPAFLLPVTGELPPDAALTSQSWFLPAMVLVAALFGLLIGFAVGSRRKLLAWITGKNREE